MRVIALRACFTADSVYHAEGSEFEYHGDLPLPSYLVPANPEDARQRMAEHERLEERMLDAVRAAAGPKRRPSDGVKVVDDLL